MNNVRNLTYAYSQAPWRKQLQFIVLFSLGLVFVALVAGVYLSVTARAATVGREILALQEEMKDLRRINADLRTQLAILTSSTVMEERALAMGFEPLAKDQPIYLVVPGYTGRRGAVLAAAPEPVTTVAASLPPEFTEPLFDWLRVFVAEQSDRWLKVQP
jgi:hypothetical protein